MRTVDAQNKRPGILNMKPKRITEYNTSIYIYNMASVDKYLLYKTTIQKAIKYQRKYFSLSSGVYSLQTSHCLLQTQQVKENISGLYNDISQTLIYTEHDTISSSCDESDVSLQSHSHPPKCAAWNMNWTGT
jgi:hypothetical protein